MEKRPEGKTTMPNKRNVSETEDALKNKSVSEKESACQKKSICKRKGTLKEKAALTQEHSLKEGQPLKKETVFEKDIPPKEITYNVVPARLFSCLNNYSTLPFIARRYGLPEEMLCEQIRQGKLSAVRFGATWLVEIPHFEHFLELYKQEAALETYLANLQAKQKRIDAALETLSRSRKELKKAANTRLDHLLETPSGIERTGLFMWMITELSVLIPNDRTREIFIDISQGKKVGEIALVWDIPECVVDSEYKSAVDILHHKFGFLKRYRKLMSELCYELKKHRLTLGIFQKEILNLLELLSLKYMAHEPAWGKKHVPLINMLSASLKRLNQEEVVLLAFQRKGIESLEELIWYINNEGFESILRFEHIGEERLWKLKRSLQELGLINSEGEITLFKDV